MKEMKCNVSHGAPCRSPHGRGPVFCKMTAVLIAAVMVFCLAGCGASGKQGTDGQPQDQTGQTDQQDQTGQGQQDDTTQDGTPDVPGADRPEGTGDGSGLYTGSVSRAEVYTAYVKFMQGWENDMIEPRMLDHVKSTALYDINGDGIEELFLYLPTMGDDGPPFLNVVTYRDGMVTRLEYAYTTKSVLTPGWTYSAYDGMPGTIAGGGGDYAVYLSKDGRSLYMYSVPAGEITYYQVSRYSISDAADISEVDQFEDDFDGPSQTDKYYSFGKSMSKDDFQAKYLAAADDVGTVLMRYNLGDDFSIMKAVKAQPCDQKDYFDMVEYMKSF